MTRDTTREVANLRRVRFAENEYAQTLAVLLRRAKKLPRGISRLPHGNCGVSFALEVSGILSTEARPYQVLLVEMNSGDSVNGLWLTAADYLPPEEPSRMCCKAVLEHYEPELKSAASTPHVRLVSKSDTEEAGC